MKLTLRILIFSSIFMSSVIPQTSHRYYTSFDTGNAEGWGFYTGAEVFVQNSLLQVFQGSVGRDAIKIITPPMGATVNDFTLSYKLGPNCTNEELFTGRIGFNSFMGLFLKEDSMSVLYATNVNNYSEPDFQILHTRHVNEYTLKGRLEVVKSGSNLNLRVLLNDTLVYTGTIANAPQELFYGQVALVPGGDNQQFQFFLDEIEVLYNPYIQAASGTFNDDFSQFYTPWLKFGSLEDVAGAISILGGKLNFKYSDTTFTNLFVASPIGAVENFEMQLTGSGDMNGGSFMMSRIHDYGCYTGLLIDDSLKLVYGFDPDLPPQIINKGAFNPGEVAVIKLSVQNNGNNIAMNVYVNNILSLTGNLNAPDSGYLSGHLCFGIFAEDSCDMYFDDVSIVYNKFVTAIDEPPGAPVTFELLQNFPNPFNPSTTIQFRTDNQGLVRLEVFSLTGESCGILINEFLPPGNHSAVFNAEDLPSGIYFYRLRSGDQLKTGKMVLLK